MLDNRTFYISRSKKLHLGSSGDELLVCGKDGELPCGESSRCLLDGWYIPSVESTHGKHEVKEMGSAEADIVTRRTDQLAGEFRAFLSLYESDNSVWKLKMACNLIRNLSWRVHYG